MADLELRHLGLSREGILWLVVSLSLVLLPHTARIPLWISLFYIGVLSVRLAHLFKGFPLPGKRLKLSLSLTAPVAILASHGTFLGLQAGVCLLTVLSALKLLEAKAARDAYVLLYLGFFLVITNFLFSQRLVLGLYMLAVVVVITATLIVVHTRTPGILPRLRLATILLFQSLPIMLMLFFLFPRVQGPLWALPKDAQQGATTGLSDTMSIGEFSKLSLSEEVAFRVFFTGPPPPPARLYWRGPVLWRTDGRRWTAPDKPPVHPWLPVEMRGRSVAYSVLLEPHHQRWLLALDMPAVVPPGAGIGDDFQLLANKPVHKLLRYDIRSYPEYRITHLTPEQTRQMLQLPAGVHLQTRTLASRWREELATPSAMIERALDYFRREPFFYTLEPPPLQGDSIDEFLFVSRRGFCEHYAAAFTVLMRAGGIPARVVTGYQGGEMNPFGDYMIVRQRDAHAWVEVWLEEQGWVRVDPTAAISPGRIEGGMRAAVGGATREVFGLYPPAGIQNLLRSLRMGMDTLVNQWNLWILGYSQVRQHKLLEQLGLQGADWQYLAFGCLAGVAGLLVLISLSMLGRRLAVDPVQRAYQRFCQKLARRGLVRLPCEGPRTFARRICAACPQLTEPVENITDLYIQIRYASPHSTSPGRQLRELRRAVVAFRP